ncbi:hypothetical protein HPB49_017274 [Dermacentor silvarum]|uniref:Uncharacterized protein n=1 Tax=Dermacentor silvarum TaxID=543639 RepID=A0ACB8E1L7_DERSI|nr:hypothetical protein HPB49_017274 [Dermacentor silvarum]
MFEGSPSMCYAYEDDGVCESSERESNVRDCGFFTPAGFFDQWASSVHIAQEILRTNCPPEAILGPPPKDQARTQLICASCTTFYTFCGRYDIDFQ